MSDALARLISLDIFRDGGSYEARFATKDDRLIALWLQRSAMPDAGGLHHRELFLYEEGSPVPDPQLLITTSSEERDLLRRLADFVALHGKGCDPAELHGKGCDPAELVRLAQLLVCIERREPLFPGMPARRPPPGWPH
ncbi:hypothetical protein [Bradyrhizobium sp. USDA 4353]